MKQYINDIAYTDTVKAIQKRQGFRNSYTWLGHAVRGCRQQGCCRQAPMDGFTASYGAQLQITSAA